MTCSDCKGSGRYVGLASEAPCKACGGTGERRFVTTTSDAATGYVDVCISSETGEHQRWLDAVPPLDLWAPTKADITVAIERYYASIIEDAKADAIGKAVEKHRRTFEPGEFAALVEADGGSVQYHEGMKFFEDAPELAQTITAEEMAAKLNAIPGMTFLSGTGTADFSGAGITVELRGDGKFYRVS